MLSDEKLKNVIKELELSGLLPRKKLYIYP